MTEAIEASPRPAQIGPYRIERELGAGGMGTVYLGKHQESGRLAAVKMLPAALAREPGFVARFNREIDATRKVDSPHVVELYESGADGDVYFYAMEYVEGETLTQRLMRDRRIPWREVVEIGVQICKALKAAHNAGVIHRDLKPSNLLLRNDGVVKLTDFGVAQVFAGGKLTVTGGVIGTAEYMSPEQAQGRRDTKQSDIYSLGAVLYVMLTGRPPFVGKSALDIAQKHRFGQFDSPKRIVTDLPYWMDEVVCKCLEKKPEDRYPDMYVLQLRLQEIPKKVELALATFDVDGASGSAETQAGGTVAKAVSPIEIGGTLMRDLVRHELEQAQRGPLGKLLDNTWVLVGLLALLVTWCVYWWNNRAPDPEALFARGVELMESEPGPQWFQARRECFEPLLEADYDGWALQVQPYLDDVELLEFSRRLVRASDEGGPQIQSSTARFLDQARRQVEDGQPQQARQTLSALLDVLPDEPAYERQRAVVRDLLRKLEESESARVTDEFLDQTLERAAKLRQEGHLTEARAVWRAVLTLYSNDPRAATAVEQVRELLAETE